MGNYIFNFGININISSGVYDCAFLKITGTNAPLNNQFTVAKSTGAPGLCSSASVFIPNATGLYYITINSNLTTLYATGASFNYFQAVRIG